MYIPALLFSLVLNFMLRAIKNYHFDRGKRRSIKTH